MHDEIDYLENVRIRKIAGKRRFAFLIITLERLSESFWLPFFISMFFVGIWLWEIQGIFGEIGADIFLALFAILFLTSLYKSFKEFKFPNKKDVDARLEKESGVKHRPIRSFEDKLANPKLEFTRDLWFRQKDIWYKNLLKIRLFVPKAILSEKDKYGFRFVALILFISGIFVSGGMWRENIISGLFPFAPIEKADVIDENILIRVIPPEYTRLPQFSLSGSGSYEKDLSIAVGSTVKIFVKSKWFEPEISVSGAKLDISKNDDNDYFTEFVVNDDFPMEGIINISRFIITDNINYKIIDDLPPTISIAKDYEILPNSEIKFYLNVNDDYIVKEIEFSMNLDREIDEPPLGQPVTENRTMMIAGGKEDTEISPYYDLTSHLWAGLPVEIKFKAIDHKGQSAETDIIKLILPERKFTHPVAKYLIEQRQSLIWAPLGSEEMIGNKLAALLKAPDMFENDIIAYLAIRAAASRLFYSKGLDSSKAVISLLWDTALRIESGDLELAAREVRQLQQELEQALKNPEITDEEIAEIMDKLNSALQNYFIQLQKELSKQMAERQEIPIIPPEMLNNLVSPDELSDFMTEMFSEIMKGDRDKAQDMLSNLQKMMDMLNPSITSALPPDIRMMNKGVNEIQELIEKQQLLLDKTLEDIKDLSSQEKQRFAPFENDKSSEIDDFMGDMPPPPTMGQGNDNEEITQHMKGRQAEQEALRYILGQLMQEASEMLDDLPENLGFAEIEMRKSSSKFGENDAKGTIKHQKKALEELKKGSQALNKQISQRLKQITALPFGQVQRDPLGRPMNGDGGNSLLHGKKIKIPEGKKKKRVEEIIKKLRDKSGEWERDKEELEYYKRLLERF